MIYGYYIIFMAFIYAILKFLKNGTKFLEPRLKTFKLYSVQQKAFKWQICHRYLN